MTRAQIVRIYHNIIGQGRSQAAGHLAIAIVTVTTFDTFTFLLVAIGATGAGGLFGAGRGDVCRGGAVARGRGIAARRKAGIAGAEQGQRQQYAERKREKLFHFGNPPLIMCVNHTQIVLWHGGKGDRKIEDRGIAAPGKRFPRALAAQGQFKDIEPRIGIHVFRKAYAKERVGEPRKRKGYVGIGFFFPAEV